MTDLCELYQQIIIDHSKTPRNFGTVADAQYVHTGHNPLCGDQLTLSINMTSTVDEVLFTGVGCAISMASASLMTEMIKGKNAAEIKVIFDDFHDLVTTGSYDAELSTKLGKLMVFAHLSEFPMRIKCATLAWHTMRAILTKAEES